MSFKNCDLFLKIFRHDMYNLDFKSPTLDKSQCISYQQLSELYTSFIKEFPIVSIEDPYDQDHWEAWSNLTANTNVQVCKIYLFPFLKI